MERHREGQTYTHRNRRVFVPDGYMVVGYIVGVHGLRGEVKVELYTDFPERFAPDEPLYRSDSQGDSLVEMVIEQARPHKNQMLLKFRGVGRREEADALRNIWLFVHEDDAISLEDGLYWVHDIIGLMMQTEDAQELGQVKEVLFTGANDVYVVEPVGTINRGQDLLVPAIADVVQSVDLERNIITVRLPPGLLEV